MKKKTSRKRQYKRCPRCAGIGFINHDYRKPCQLCLSVGKIPDFSKMNV